MHPIYVFSLYVRPQHQNFLRHNEFYYVFTHTDPILQTIWCRTLITTHVLRTQRLTSLIDNGPQKTSIDETLRSEFRLITNQIAEFVVLPLIFVVLLIASFWGTFIKRT